MALLADEGHGVLAPHHRPREEIVVPRPITHRVEVHATLAIAREDQRPAFMEEGLKPELEPGGREVDDRLRHGGLLEWDQLCELHHSKIRYGSPIAAASLFRWNPSKAPIGQAGASAPDSRSRSMNQRPAGPGGASLR